MKRLFVITGAPGSGKTTLIGALRRHGFKCIDETSREIIQEQLKIGGNVLPWIDLVSFGHAVLDKRIKQYIKATEGLHFLDRGIPDIIGYLVADEKPVSGRLHAAAKDYKYDKIVFFAEPWEEIYSLDSERKESFESANKISTEIKKVYLGLGYEVVVLPKGSVEERADFVLKKLGLDKTKA